MVCLNQNYTCHTWQVTCDMWHVTHGTWQVGGGESSLQTSASLLLRPGSYSCTGDRWLLRYDTWNLTFDTLHVTQCGGWKFSQNFSFLALTVWDIWCFEDLEEKGDILIQLINKPAAQAAGADHSRCNSTNRKKLHFQQNNHKSWTSSSTLMPFKIYNLLKFPNMRGSTISNH